MRSEFERIRDVQNYNYDCGFDPLYFVHKVYKSKVEVIWVERTERPLQLIREAGVPISGVEQWIRENLADPSSAFCKRTLGVSTMNKSLYRLCLTAAIAFIAGAVFVLIAIVVWKSHFEPNRSQRQREAYAFFYKTMHELFEGTFNPEEGSVSTDALETFKKYESRLGDKCRLFIGDDSSGYFGGIAFFPSGDSFYVVIVRMDEHMVLKMFNPEDWERFWMDVMPRTENDNKQL